MLRKEQDLTISLETFGLSKYEAQAYVTLITKGTISASELAYYAKIPRTKVYPTLLKLEKKRLAIISKRKPIICNAIAPEDAFDELIHDQINRVNGMNSVVTKLKRTYENSKKARGTEEKRYFNLSPNHVSSQLKTMIEKSKSSILVMMDTWGLNLFAQCREEILHALRKNVDIKLILPLSLVGSESFRVIPNDVKIRISEITQNCVLCDHSEILLIDSNNGKGVIFTSTQVLENNYAKIFSRIWKEAEKIGSVKEMGKNHVQEIFKIIDVLRENGLGFALNSTLCSEGKEIDWIKLLEKNGINLKRLDFEELVKIIDGGLQITCAGQIQQIEDDNHIVIESKMNSGRSLPWAMILDRYLNLKGHKTRLMYQNHSRNGEKVHIKITSKTR